MKKPVIFIVIFVLLLSIFSIFLFLGKEPTKISTKPSTIKTTLSPTAAKEIQYLAAFAVFTNGTFQNFSASIYYNRSKSVYIQKDNPNIIHVKKEKTTWGDFFTSLPMTLTENCLITATKEIFCTDEKSKMQFYINGEKTNNLFGKEIQNGDRALITYGSESASLIKTQMSQIPNIQK